MFLSFRIVLDNIVLEVGVDELYLLCGELIRESFLVGGYVGIIIVFLW